MLYGEDDEYREIFGDSETPKIIAEKLNQIFETNECTHNQVFEFPTGNCGYCKNCGLGLKKASGNWLECDHGNSYEDDNGLHLCIDCDTEIEIFDDEPEWRYYGNADTRSSRDPARCHRGRQTGRGISKLFQDHGIYPPDAIVAQVESKYETVVGNAKVRGKRRVEIVAACLFYTYKEFGEYRTSDYIRSLFGLTAKGMSSGISEYLRSFPSARTDHITAEDLIRWTLTLTGVSTSHYPKIIQIARYLEGSSQLLKRSSPQSVASAIVYFYLCLNPEYKAQLGLSKNKFAEKALLSDITVTKLVKEAAYTSKCAIVM